MSVTGDLSLHPLGKSVNDRRTDAVQTAGNLVTAAAELTACVQNGENNRQCRYSHLFMHGNGNTTSVITD